LSHSSNQAAGQGRLKVARGIWKHISVEGPDTLYLYGGHHRGHLDICLINHSDQPLDPETSPELVFSFKLLDEHGQVTAFEATRTPLTARVPAGAEHHQKVTVVVPPARFKQAATIRVGLLMEGHYWVESINPKHPKQVKLSLAHDLSPAEMRMESAKQIWPSGTGNGMRWPYGTMMVAERHKLFYIPVAKCACTSLKSMMIRLADVDRAEIAVELGVHFVTDRFNTGVQLKDKPIDRAREILASDDYFKFSVIRDPFERLVSAYLEKFVYNRHSQRNQLHTRPVIREVQGTDDIDIGQGISFDDFIHYVLRQDPYDLDPHWRPQHIYFLGVPHISRIFRLENINELEQFLLQNHGITVKLGHQNKTRKSDIFLPEAATLPAVEFDHRQAINPGSFVSSWNEQAIRDYYAEDFKFYHAAG
jgi:hypothetical protein